MLNFEYYWNVFCTLSTSILKEKNEKSHNIDSRFACTSYVPKYLTLSTGTRILSNLWGIFFYTKNSI